MSDTDLSQEEMELLVRSIFAVFRLVATADGRADAREIESFKQMLKVSAQSDNPLLQRVLQQAAGESEQRTSSPPVPGSGEADAPETLRSAADLLESKLGEKESLGFKVGLVMMGKRIAEASGGGFLGLGKRTAQEEAEAIAAIKSLLRVEIPDR